MTETSLVSAPWLSFLTQQGASIASPDSTNGTETLQLAEAAATPFPKQFIAPLTELGLIALHGDDAASFLHNQLTNDVERLDLGSARLAGYCTPKGRLLASFLMWKDADHIWLQLPRTLLPAIQKRLQMFVLRAKVKLSDQSDQRVALGLVGDTAAQVLLQWFPNLPAQAYAKIDNQHGTLIRLEDSRQAPRYQWILPADQAQDYWAQVTSVLRAAPGRAWRLSDIYAGIPVITKATQEQFVPQMINFELVGGINFKKGCYPGQEIVARSQYLGKLKRRSLLALVAATAQAGSEVFSSADPGQPCGMIVNAEPADDGQSACLVELKLAATENGSIHLGTPDGPVLQLQALPYALTEPQ
ncbi:hypothetical protein FHW67_001262 [Herbaspirillum sp. Sphag1AN]|uniref:CAF17-like 4Fe-4S cluster assembly/insertion protein YgfZ n=1 Tax=unclassified Herbaspirillum TaxID=2624150 RepID=UPI0016138FF5|nr:MULTISPECIES: folate-binding protein YgfZ [unclassified Herbaspirillum]MBB3211994.1 hypothetical protein [Herbaspirillum sp. Sphag1AN]MBB3244172.1 hypothetical protein [Herbaspirillum sp. Sphag64]